MIAIQEIHHVVVMTKDELIEKTDKAISELVYPKYELQKAYNYYNGVRDADQFRYLEEVYGTNTPTTLHFTPLIKKHIDALIGEYLGTPIIPKISCKDSETISNIDREKQLKIASELHNYLKQNLKKSVLNFINGKDITDGLVEQQLKRIVEDINNTFVSEYEIAAQNVIEYIMQSRDTDIITVLRDLLLDLLITGYSFYRVVPTVENNNIRIQALSPLNTFIDRNFESPYIKNSYRAVVRNWMTKNQILNEYGKDMKQSDRKLLDEKWDSVYENAMYYVRMGETNGIPNTDGIQAGVEVTPGYPDSRNGTMHELIPVYEVEWLETDKDFVMQRYKTIRIGEQIYILKGKDEQVMRSQSNPTHCGLSVNGIYFLNRGVKPYSMVLACAHLQDQYDLLNFYRDNLIANSGTVGDWIDLTLIPEKLGVNLPERLVKWQALKKQGLGVLDSSQEGRIASGQAPLNTIFNGFDNTVKAQAVQAIQMAIDAVEQTTSSITGVFRERLNGIEQRDAVTNVKIGQNNSFIITKQYYHQMDLVVNEMLLDCLNLAKVVFKNGLTGTIILGDKYQKVFTALPEYFTMTDHDIRIITSTDIVKDLEQIKNLIPEFVKSGGLPPDIIIEAITSKSIPDLKYKIKRAMRIQKDENNQMQQLSQQNQQLQQQAQQMQKQLQEAQKKIEQLNQTKLQLEQKQLEQTYKIEMYKANTERTFREATIEEQKRRTNVEISQLTDGNPYNDKIKQFD